MKADKVIIAGAAIIVVLAILLIIAGACSACVLLVKEPGHVSYGQTVHETRTDSHAAAENIDLDVSTIGGNIVIQEWTEDRVEITYDVHAPEGHLSDIVTSTKDTKGANSTKIVAKAELYSQSIFNSGNRGADVTVKVPKDSSYRLSLHTLGGDIRVPPLHGSAVYMDTLGGKLELNGGRYDLVNMNTAGGNIYASYESANGTFNTLGGDITVDTTQTAGTINVNTAGGNIDVRIPSGTLFSVDASTMGGRIRHGSISMNTTTKTEWTLKGNTAGGAGSLHIVANTLGGNIDISY